MSSVVLNKISRRTHLQDSSSNMAITWTDDEKERLLRREVIIFQQNVREQDLDDKGLPTDIHIVEYSQGGLPHSDIVRAGKMSDIFDAYYDKLKISGGGVVTAIKSGFGTIKPKLWSSNKDDKKSK